MKSRVTILEPNLKSSAISKLFKIILLQFLFVSVLSSSAFAQAGTNTIDAGAKLLEGQRLISANKSYYLTMQADGNLCVYSSSNQFVWCSMIYFGKGSYVSMQADGNLVVYDGKNNPVWNTMTQAFYDSKYATAEWKAVRAVLEDNGTLSLYTAANKKVWSSNDNPAPPVVSPGVGFTGPVVKKDLRIILPGSSKAAETTVEINNRGEVFYHGDMKLGTVESLTKEAAAPPKPEDSFKWPNSTVYYILPTNHLRKDIIQKGIEYLNNHTTICMVPRTTQTDYVEFITRNGNWANIGRIGGKQEISVENTDIGTVVHEVMHALGFDHTQCRQDRDNYVTIDFGNIESGQEHNFKKSEATHSNLGVYDFTSCMHYHAYGFAKTKGTKTMFRKDGTDDKMGQDDGLSATDVSNIALVYPKCPSKPSVKPLPTTTTTPTTPTTNPATCEGKDAVNKYPALFMKPGDILQENEKLMSANGRFQLRGTRDGNFIIEQLQGSGNCPFTEIYRFPLTHNGNKPAISFLRFGADGNVCVISKQGKFYCATHGQDEVTPIIINKSVKLELTDDGRLRLVNSNGQEIWATSKTSPLPKVTEPSGGEDLPYQVILYMANDVQESYDVTLERGGKVIGKYFLPGQKDRDAYSKGAPQKQLIISEPPNIDKMGWKTKTTNGTYFTVRTAGRYGDVMKVNKIGGAELKQFLIDRTIGGTINSGIELMDFYPNRGLSGKKYE